MYISKKILTYMHGYCNFAFKILVHFLSPSPWSLSLSPHAHPCYNHGFSKLSHRATDLPKPTNLRNSLTIIVPSPKTALTD